MSMWKKKKLEKYLFCEKSWKSGDSSRVLRLRNCRVVAGWVATNLLCHLWYCFVFLECMLPVVSLGHVHNSDLVYFQWHGAFVGFHSSGARLLTEGPVWGVPILMHQGFLMILHMSINLSMFPHIPPPKPLNSLIPCNFSHPDKLDWLWHRIEKSAKASGESCRPSTRKWYVDQKLDTQLTPAFTSLPPWIHSLT